MKKTPKDRFSDIALRMLRPFGFLWMRLDIQKNLTSYVDFSRKEPFVVVGNHTYLYDVVQIALHFKITPAIVAQEYLLSAKGLRWLLLYVGKVIPKSKGSSDVRTIRQIMQYVKKGYPIMIMPEGDSTFFGETGYIEPSTGKLIKKLNLDVIVAKTKGGYLSRPRWATSARRNRYIDLTYSTLLTKEQVGTMSVEEIQQELIAGLSHNDYEWQHQVQHKFGGERMAEGFDNVIYRCPVCGAFHSFVVKHNEIQCQSCKTVATMNEYGFIEGFPVATMIELDALQRPYDDELKQLTFQTSATLQYVDNVQFKRTKPVSVDVAYHENTLHIKGKSVIEIPVEEMINPVITMRRNLTFEYQQQTYLMKLERFAMSFLRVVQTKY
jgi:1-acyl-sn-glycerol-3-phosphate acyltransferase